MLRQTVLVLTLTGLCACPGAMLSARHSTGLVPTARDVTYTRTLAAMNQQGARILHADPQAGIVNAEVGHAAVLGVTLEAAPEGTQVSVSCTPLANKLILGSCTAGDDLLQQLR